MSTTPFDVLAPNHAGGAQRRAVGSWRGIITKVNRATVDGADVPTMTFNVRPLNALVVSGAADGEFKDVPMLQAGFGSLRAGNHHGIVYVPEEGSIVLVVPDGAAWVIVGCYSGPAHTAGTQSTNAEKPSYNLGIEGATNAFDTESGAGIPALFGLDPGDAILGAEQNRVKVKKVGVLIAAGVSCVEVFKPTGEKLERYLTREWRSAGLAGRHAVHLGDADRRFTSQNATKFDYTALAPADETYVLTTEVTRSTPLPKQINKPYVIRQVGHVGAEATALGFTAPDAEMSTLAVQRETAARSYAVLREAVILPSRAPTDRPIDDDHEMDTASQLYDFRVQADGSFQLQAGNPNGVHGAAAYDPSSPKLDVSIGYDAQSRKLIVKLGAKVSVEMNATTGEVKSKMGALSLEVDSLEVTAQNQIKFKARSIGFDTDNLRLDSAGMVVKGTVAAKDVLASPATDPRSPLPPMPAVRLNSHTHPAPGGTTGSPNPS